MKGNILKLITHRLATYVGSLLLAMATTIPAAQAQVNQLSGLCPGYETAGTTLNIQYAPGLYFDLYAPPYLMATILSNAAHGTNVQAVTSLTTQPLSLSQYQGFPGAVLFHGGGWTSPTEGREDMEPVGCFLAWNGMVAISVDYHLAPVNGVNYGTVNGTPITAPAPLGAWPAQYQDGVAAIQFMRQYASYLNVNPNQIVTMGGSAGGLIAADLGQTVPGINPTLANAVVTFWSPWNLADVTGYQSQVNMYAAENQIEELVGQDPPSSWANAIPLANQASPFTYISSSSAPTLIFQGSQDDVVPPEQATAALAKLQSNVSQNALPYYVLSAFTGGHGWPSNNCDITNPLSQFLTPWVAPVEPWISALFQQSQVTQFNPNAGC